MWRSFTLGRSGATALLALCVGRPASGTEPACQTVEVSAAPTVSARWPTLPEQLRETLGDRRDIDRCARVRLEAHGDALVLAVRLDDGRSAVRRVHTADDARVALEALLLIPPRDVAARHTEPPVEPTPRGEPAPPAAAAATSARGASPPAPLPPPGAAAPATAPPRAQPAPPGHDAPKAARPASTNTSALELSLVGSARVGDDQTGHTLGILAGVETSGWLVGVDGRVGETTGPPDSASPPQSALELALLGGVRLGKTTPVVDLVAGPNFAYQQASNVESGPEGTRRTEESRLVPRLSAAARVHWFTKFGLGGFVGVEGFVGAPGASSSDEPASGLVPLPVWMLGLSIGATVGL